MSNAELIHIFDNSTCLTKRQMKDYVKGIMTNEEAHAVEVHLNSCPLCSDAIEGLFEQQESGLAAMNEINGDFLKDHFGLSNPQVHLNSMASAQPAKHQHINKVHSKTKTFPNWRTTSIAAALLLLVALIWFYRISRDDIKSQPQIAQELSNQEPAVIAPAETQSHNSSGAIAMNDTKAKKAGASKLGEPQAAQPALMDAVASREAEAMPMTPAAAPTASGDIKATAPKEKEDIVVSAYKAPLVGEDERKVVTAEEVQKMPTTNTNEVASSSAGVYQKSFGNASDRTTKDESAVNLTAQRVNAAPAMAKKARAKSISEREETAPDRLQQADKLYDRKSYNDALNAYSKEMQSNDAGRKQQATIGAARCYLALGNKAKAKQLLQSLADTGSGAPKRQAKRILNSME